MKLTTAQKCEICKLFYSGEKSKSELAKSFNVSHTAISKILNDEKVSKSFKILGNQKIEETALSMLSFMESKCGNAQELITEIMSELKETLAEKVKHSSLKDCVSTIELLSKTFSFGEKNGDENETETETPSGDLYNALINREIKGFNDEQDEV